MNASLNFDVLVIGAGMSGLIAASRLSDQGLRVMVIDEGRSVGGRLATRRVSGSLVDHGAQFFTARSPQFRVAVEHWVEEGIVYVWSSGFSDGQRTPEEFDGHPRYAVHGGMNALAKHITSAIQSEVTFRVNCHMVSLTPALWGWEAQDENGHIYRSRGVLLTPPVPQSLELLGETPLHPADRTALERIEYAPCMAGMFRLDGDTLLPEPGALQRPNAPLSWIADNQRKGLSSKSLVVTVHTNEEYSRILANQADRQVLAALAKGLEPFLTPSSHIVEAQLKRWPYARPITLHPERCLVAQKLPPLAFAGDAFGEARVEGAFLSGLTVGKILAARLKSNNGLSTNAETGQE